MLSRFMLALLFSVAASTWAEEIVYELYGLEVKANPTLLAAGSKEYSDSDTQIERWEHQGRVHWPKSLPPKGE